MISIYLYIVQYNLKSCWMDLLIYNIVFNTILWTYKFVWTFLLTLYKTYLKIGNPPLSHNTPFRLPKIVCINRIK